MIFSRGNYNFTIQKKKKKKNSCLLLATILFLISCNNGKGENNNDKGNLSEMKSESPMSNEETEAKKLQEPANEASKQNPYKDAKIQVQVFKNDTVKPVSEYKGYGYNILINEELTVHQPHKPGVPGMMGFKSVADAKKAGDFIAYKIRNNSMPPTVSMRELDSLGVLK